MRKITAVVASVVAAATFVLSAATPAWGGPSSFKPVVTVGPLDVYDSGGVSPDTWRTYVKVPVGGYKFTPGGNVYITFQDLSAGTPAINGEWIRAGSGPCGLECSNYGRISRAWDQVKSPQGHGWSTRDVRVTC